MAIREKITFENGNTIVHFLGTKLGDYALCGADLAGDSIHENGRYEDADHTLEKVTCSDCVDVVKYCKKIKANEYK